MALHETETEKVKKSTVPAILSGARDLRILFLNKYEDASPALRDQHDRFE
jgi:hypothetical protein